MKKHGKSDKYFVKLKLRRDPASSTSDIYKFKMSLFENGKLEELLFLFFNFNMNLAVSGTLEVSAKYQYLLTIVCREVLCQFDSLYADIEGIEALNVDYIIRSLDNYFLPVNSLLKKSRNAPWNETTTQFNCYTLCGTFYLSKCIFR